MNVRLLARHLPVQGFCGLCAFRKLPARQKQYLNPYVCEPN